MDDSVDGDRIGRVEREQCCDLGRGFGQLGELVDVEASGLAVDGREVGVGVHLVEHVGEIVAGSEPIGGCFCGVRSPASALEVTIRRTHVTPATSMPSR